MSRSWVWGAPLATVLLSGVSALALSAGPAHAVCTITDGAGVTVSCNGDFSDTLTYTSSDLQLELGSGETGQSITTDLSGNDRIEVNGTDVSSSLDVFEDGDNRLDLREGNDVVSITNGTFTGEIFGGPGNDTFEFLAGDNPVPNTAGGTDITFSGDDGNDRVFIAEGVVVGEILGGAGNDRFDIFGEVFPAGSSFAPFAVDGGDDDDVIRLELGSRVSGSVSGGAGDDIIASLGTVTGIIAGGEGNDTVAVRSGAIGGSFGGGGIDTITLGGGNIGGAIRGFETVIVDPTQGTETLSGFLTLLGTGESDLIVRNVEQAAIDVFDGETESESEIEAQTQTQTETQDPLLNINVSGVIIDGFATGLVENSNLGPLNGVLGIGQLTVNNSRLGLVGASSLLASGTGNLVVNTSTLDFINGVAGDTLSVGTLSFNSSTLGIDVDPISVGFADELIVNGGPGAFNATGANQILVNFTEPIDVSEPRVIPIIGVSGGEGTGSLAQSFLPIAVGENASPLVALTAVDGVGGGLALEAREAESVLPPPAAVNTTQAAMAGDTINDINNDLVDVLTDFQTINGNRQQVTPQFGIFSNGSFGRMSHDGFDVTGGGLNLVTPAFDADSFSLIGVGEADASAAFGLDDDDIGLRLSAFGGYVENEVTFSRNDGAGGITPFRGRGKNTGGVMGGTALASKIQGLGNLNYGLVSGAFFFGDTDVTNGETGGTGEYGTTGYVVSAKVGRNMPIADRVRLDLRVGASYQVFRGTSFTDSTGILFGSSETSYGLLSFEPGLSTSLPVGDFIVSPSVRAILQTRVGYNNSASIQNIDFDFDDGDLVAGGQLGAAVRFSDRFSGGAFVEGRFTEDSRSVFGKLSLKYTIPKS